MNTKLLVNTITEITETESKNNFQQTIKSIITHFGNNNSGEVENFLNQIKQQVRDSVLYRYVKHDSKTLKELGCEDLFSHGLINKLDSILQGDAYKITSELNTLVSQRDTKISQLGSLLAGLKSIGIQAEESDSYQIIFGLPDTYKDLQKLQKTVGDLERYLFFLSKEKGDFKISSVNDGCIELIIDVANDLAEVVSVGLDYILKLYGTYEIFNKTKEGFEKYRNKKAQKEAIKTHEEQLEEEKNALCEEYVKEVSGKDATPEQKNNNRTFFFKIAGHLEQGMSIEVKTPRIEKPAEAKEEDDDETKKNKTKALKSFEQKRVIDERNRELDEISQGGIDLMLPSAED